MLDRWLREHYNPSHSERHPRTWKVECTLAKASRISHSNVTIDIDRSLLRCSRRSRHRGTPSQRKVDVIEAFSHRTKPLLVIHQSIPGSLVVLICILYIHRWYRILRNFPFFGTPCFASSCMGLKPLRAQLYQCSGEAWTRNQRNTWYVRYHECVCLRP